ncbi:MAG: hypothetical protein ACRC6K_00060 [Fusobacteriaceae bacterium]
MGILRFLGFRSTVKSISKNITDLKTTKIDFKKVLIIIFIASILLLVCLGKDTEIALKIMDKFLVFIDILLKNI